MLIMIGSFFQEQNSNELYDIEFSVRGMTLWIMTATSVCATKGSLVVRYATEIKFDPDLMENRFCTILGFFGALSFFVM